MIPKTIHYCWFGRGPKPKLVRKCIASWKKYCPDYTIIEWNEDNFDISSAPLFVRQAYEAKKWAFATDYIRLRILYDNGGIYMDTDVELIRSPELLLNNKVYFGFEYDYRVASGLGCGAEKHAPVLLELMEPYETKPFILPDGDKDQTWNSIKETEVLIKHGLVLDGHEQLLENTIHIYPVEYLHPFHWGDKAPHLTEKTISIHWYDHSWWDNYKIIKLFRDKSAYKCVMYILRTPNRIAIHLLGRERYARLKRKLNEKKTKRIIKQ